MTDAPAGGWTTGTIIGLDHPTDRLVRLRLHVEDRVDHLPGQHYVVRLRAPDDYTAQRSYSVASDPDDPLLELMVECLPGGEVSGHLHDVAEVGDVLELRGPIGGWFVWKGDVPSVAIGGGSGVVPLVAMARLAHRLGLRDRLRIVALARTWDELPYAAELQRYGAFIALTRENLGGRVAAPPYHDELAPYVDGAERAYVCGSVGFASYATRLLEETGMRTDAIRVEQFGETG
ncbi:FAD-binding oxidoreductase [Nocardioides sp. YIM 152315]|uniref:FAD-binding oxidoreductase n=1 Tax=Nocardioides sp. YIM 152315 TaxID=3031760 RepID=UPI0023DC86ED|nr:FAD-binding oxidoreductase [Nocardioides sp. YIM 152315]MDF1602429.1 FAD-binding oxidoreductase [Nocardioides sp. YIM 152315]